MIRPASQRAIDRTWRGVAPTSRRSASSRPRRSAIITSVLTTAIEVKAKIIATNTGPSQRVISRVGVGRGGQQRAVADPQSGIPSAQSSQARSDGRGADGAYEDRPEQRAGLVAGGELGGEQGVPERQVAVVDRHHGGVGTGPVAEHDHHAVTDPSAGGVGAVAPEPDRWPCKAARDPAVTPTSSPPPCPPSRI
jgi:hypothetical protein